MKIQRIRFHLPALLAAATLALAIPSAFADDTALINPNSNADMAQLHGNGIYQIGGSIDVDFRVHAKTKAGHSPKGSFRQTLVFQGLLVDFAGDVTCMSVDTDNGRAWIGGIVTENNSDHEAFTTEIHQPGRDVWFRVLDTGKKAEDADRSTFLGFEGAAGIITSEEYCTAKIWPGPPDEEPNARTSPVIKGDIRLKVNGQAP